MLLRGLPVDAWVWTSMRADEAAQAEAAQAAVVVPLRRRLADRQAYWAQRRATQLAQEGGET